MNFKNNLILHLALINKYTLTNFNILVFLSMFLAFYRQNIFFI